MKKILGSLLLSMVFMSNASAAIVSGIIEGQVMYADSGNPFGVSVGDTVTLDYSFDDTGFTGVGFETVFYNDPANDLLFTIGSQSFTDEEDTAGGVGPLMLFEDGFLTEIKYDTQFGTNGGIFYSFGSFFEGGDFGTSMGGDWNLGSVILPITAVPVPAAAWLFASGLLGIIGVARRSPTKT